MKNCILIILFCIYIFFVLPAFADILPLSSKSINYYGIGVLNLPESCNIYEKPDKTSNIIFKIDYHTKRHSAIIRSDKKHKSFYIAYVPSENIALFTVETNNGNWYNIYLNQKTGKTGWVYTENQNAFYTYKSLFYKYGKKYGLKMYNDLPEEKKVLYAKQSTESQKLEQLSYPKFIKFTVIMGNWMLVTVNDMEKHAKVGWYNWRNDDGTLNLFPNFKEQF